MGTVRNKNKKNALVYMIVFLLFFLLCFFRFRATGCLQMLRSPELCGKSAETVLMVIFVVCVVFPVSNYVLVIRKVKGK
jgi:hypothetical protein